MYFKDKTIKSRVPKLFYKHSYGELKRNRPPRTAAPLKAGHIRPPSAHLSAYINTPRIIPLCNDKALRERRGKIYKLPWSFSWTSGRRPLKCRPFMATLAHKHLCTHTRYANPQKLFKEGPLTTSNQLLSPYAVALRLRYSNQHFYMHLMGPKMWSYPPFSFHHKSNWIFSSRLPNFEQNQSGRFMSMVPP